MDLNVKISDIIAAVLNMDPEQLRGINYDEPLNTIGMDSINCMDIVIQIEEELQVVFQDDELLLDNLNSINKLSLIVSQKLEQHSVN
ncbi:acyl carrier protein [Paenibacillus sp. SI8]|uniref:acyl carrier protein n=1 Tax=unclassified Paenibacillus TaxID=185978 RepID=UPI003467B41F